VSDFSPCPRSRTRRLGRASSSPPLPRAEVGARNTAPRIPKMATAKRRKTSHMSSRRRPPPAVLTILPVPCCSASEFTARKPSRSLPDGVESRIRRLQKAISPGPLQTASAAPGLLLRFLRFQSSTRHRRRQSQPPNPLQDRPEQSARDGDSCVPLGHHHHPLRSLDRLHRCPA
jgi:hypothetical protein